MLAFVFKKFSIFFCCNQEFFVMFIEDIYQFILDLILSAVSIWDLKITQLSNRRKLICTCTIFNLGDALESVRQIL